MSKCIRKGDNVQPVAILVAPSVEVHDDPARVIGRRTRCWGTQIRGLHGHEVVIVAVFKDALRVREHDYLTTDQAIREAGGVGTHDRVEVAPVLPDGRLSFVTSDPRAVDLEVFSGLAAGQAGAAEKKGERG